MVIRRSSSPEIRALIDRLMDDNSVARDAAAARLSVIGPRATRALLAALEATERAPQQAAILRTLEAINDPRGLPAVSSLVDATDPDVAAAAVSVLRRFLRHGDARFANAAFERLTSVTLDPGRAEPVRAAALEALSDLPAETTAEVLRQLREDPSARLAEAAVRGSEDAGRPLALAQIAESSRCPDPQVLRRMIAAEGPAVPLPVLGRLVEVLRAREEAESASPRRTEWQAARGAVHQVLAERGSRLALYDLRETLAVAPGPLPVGFVAALQRIGDASCLDAVAAAYLRARVARDAWWLEHLASVFKGILARERLTRRSAAVKRLISKYPEAAGDLLARRR